MNYISIPTIRLRNMEEKTENPTKSYQVPEKGKQLNCLH